MPIPGSPARRITDAGANPPPSTRSKPAIPVETRDSVSAIVPSVLMEATDPFTPRAAPSIVPQAAQPGQRPTHWATCCRHPEQVKIVRGRVMDARR